MTMMATQSRREPVSVSKPESSWGAMSRADINVDNYGGDNVAVGFSVTRDHTGAKGTVYLFTPKMDEPFTTPSHSTTCSVLGTAIELLRTRYGQGDVKFEANANTVFKYVYGHHSR